MAQVPGGPVNQVVLLNSIWIGPRAQVANVSPRPFQRDCSWVTKSWPARWYGINISKKSWIQQTNFPPFERVHECPLKINAPRFGSWCRGQYQDVGVGWFSNGSGNPSTGVSWNFLETHGSHCLKMFPKMEVMEELAGIIEIYLTSSLRKCHCYQWHNFLKAFGKQSNPMLKAYAASSPGSARRWSTPFAWFLQRRLCGSQNWLGDIGTPSSNMHQRIRRRSWMGIATKA